MSAFAKISLSPGFHRASSPVPERPLPDRLRPLWSTSLSSILFKDEILDLAYGRDVHGNGIPNGNPTGMGIIHGIGNGNKTEWETTSMGMGITCTPMRIYSHSFFAASSANATRYCFFTAIWMAECTITGQEDRRGSRGDRREELGYPVADGDLAL